MGRWTCKDNYTVYNKLIYFKNKFNINKKLLNINIYIYIYY